MIGCHATIMKEAIPKKERTFGVGEEMLMFLTVMEDHEEKAKIIRIYQLHGKMMYQVAFSMLHNKEDSEDAVQTALLNACKHIKKIQSPDEFSTKWYMITLTKNAAGDIYRKKKNRWKNEVPFSDAVVTDDLVTQFEGESELAKKIETLQPRDRDILILRYYHGFGYAEISKMLGVSKEAAKKAGQRAIQRIEKLMKEGDNQ